MRALALCCLAVALAAPRAARAQFAVYTDLAAFLGATAAAGTDTFDDLAAGAAAAPLARSAGPYSYTATVTTTQLFAAGPAGDRWLSANTATDRITFAGFGAGVRGVGGFFFGTDLDGLVRPGTTLTLRVAGAGGTLAYTLSGATPGSFVGFVSPAAVTSLSVEAAQPPDGLAWPTVNDLVLAQAPAAVVPEPSTAALLAAGALTLGIVRHRRRPPARLRPRAA